MTPPLQQVNSWAGSKGNLNLSSTYATMVQENFWSVSAGSDQNVNHTLSKTGDPSGSLKPLHGSLPVARWTACCSVRFCAGASLKMF